MHFDPENLAPVALHRSPGVARLPAVLSEVLSIDSPTELLHAWRAGDSEALDALLPLLYQDLKAIADREFAKEAQGHTLQATAVLNEALLRMVGKDITWEDRNHFLAVMTKTMRRVLVDHARSRARNKRGGDQLRVTLATHLAGASDVDHSELLDLDQALSELADLDPRKSQIMELHYFGGLKYNEIAQVVELSEASVHRELRFARAWLRANLQGN